MSRLPALSDTDIAMRLLPLSELHEVCRRMFLSMGYTYGGDETAAVMACASELYGFNGLNQVHSELDVLQYLGFPLDIDYSSTRDSYIVDGNGHSLLSVASFAFDLAQTLQHVCKDKVEIRNFRHPEFAFINAIDVSFPLDVIWWQDGEGRRFQQRNDDNICGIFACGEGAPDRVLIQLMSDQNATTDAEKIVGYEHMDKQWKQQTHEGIAVKKNVWNDFSLLAKATELAEAG